MTAENARRGMPPGERRPGFNEAAADDRGKRQVAGSHPRVRPGFNEAAADDRGKRTPPILHGQGRVWRFNEAAADDRGKREGEAEGHARRDASMRPRPMTAENGQGQTAVDTVLTPLQ